MSDLTNITRVVDRSLMEMMVFPIIKVLYYSNGSEKHKIIGTGFFLDFNGLFISARHVFIGEGSALDLEDANGYSVYCVHSINLSRRIVARRIDVSSIRFRNDTDIASGYVERNQFGKGDNSITDDELTNNAHFNSATATEVPIGTRIWTVAYPLTTITHLENDIVKIYLRSDLYTGKITKHYPERRDNVLNWPCYQTDMEIKSGASGGPVCISKSDGIVFGVNCSSFDPIPISYVSSLAPLKSQTG